MRGVSQPNSCVWTDLRDARRVEDVGGKAHCLGEIIRAGLPVPPGIVLGVNNFRQFVDDHCKDLKPSAADRILPPHELERQRQSSLQFPMRPSLMRAIDAIPALPCFRSGDEFAVRSSAVGEDATDAAYAGLLETTTNVSATSLEQAIRSCWASYWSPRVMAYQQQRRIRLHGLAVIIQEQVRSEISGVLFTIDPTGRRQDAMVLEWCDGPGENLVGGHVSPSRCYVDRSGRNATIHCDATRSRPLDEANIARLFDIGRTLESHFECPQDIEWTIDPSGTLHVLQSRPITAVSRSVSESASSERPAGQAVVEPTQVTGVVWSNANINENYPQPVTPLLYSISQRAYYHYFRGLGVSLGVSTKRLAQVDRPLQELVGVHRGRLYYNLSNIHLVLRSAPLGDWLVDAFNLFVGTQSESRPAVADRSLRMRLGDWLEAIRCLCTSASRLRSVGEGVTRFEQRVQAYATEISQTDLAQWPREELLRKIDEFLDIRFHHWTDAALADASSMISYQVWRQVAKHCELSGRNESTVGDAASNSLLKGLRDVKSGEPVHYLWQLAEQIRTTSSLSSLFGETDPQPIWNQLQSDPSHRPFYQQCRDYLNRWGFRCTGELMFTVESMEDRPTDLVRLLQRYVLLSGQSPQGKFDQLERDRDQQLSGLLAESATVRLGFIKRLYRTQLTRRSLKWAQDSVKLRERARYHQALLYRRFRSVVLALGDHWVREGWLGRADDILMLGFDEIRRMARGREMFPDHLVKLTQQRREAFEAYQRTDPPPNRFVLPLGTYWEAGRMDDATNLTKERSAPIRTGCAVCGGRAEGRAVVMHDASQMDQLQQGDILVVQQTDPGWAPILFLAGGLVMERGGMLSHGAILAREYGIPSVVEIDDATRWITTGMRICVDGDQGEVRIIDA